MYDCPPVFDFIFLYVIGSYRMAGAFTGIMYPVVGYASANQVASDHFRPVFRQHLVKIRPAYILARMPIFK